MKLKWNKVIELKNTYYQGDRIAFACRLGVYVSQLICFIDTGRGGGPLMISGVAHICKEKGLDFWDYIDLE